MVALFVAVSASPPLLRCQRDQARFLYPAPSGDPNLAPSWNVAPTLSPWCATMRGQASAAWT
jgi:hypothetical protein